MVAFAVETMTAVGGEDAFHQATLFPLPYRRWRPLTVRLTNTFAVGDDGGGEAFEHLCR